MLVGEEGPLAPRNMTRLHTGSEPRVGTLPVRGVQDEIRNSNSYNYKGASASPASKEHACAQCGARNVPMPAAAWPGQPSS